MGEVVNFPSRKPAKVIPIRDGAPTYSNTDWSQPVVWTCGCGGHEFLLLKQGGFVCTSCGGHIGNMDWHWKGGPGAS